MNIVSRAEWGARQPKAQKFFTPSELPCSELWLHHTAGSESGADGMRRIQRFHMDTRGWHDIAYSFVVDRDGTVYEGRGFGVKPGATKNHNSDSHAICVMGNYQTHDVPGPVVEALAGLVRHGARRGFWPDRFTGGHRDVGSTSCPGTNLYALLDDINRRAARDARYVMDILLYAKRSAGPDLVAALAAAAALPGGGGVTVTCDKKVAAEALDQGVTVYAVGGPAAKALPAAKPLVGDDAVDTLTVIAEAAQTW